LVEPLTCCLAYPCHFLSHRCWRRVCRIQPTSVTLCFGTNTDNARFSGCKR
jgi:hypothetical protein